MAPPFSICDRLRERVGSIEQDVRETTHVKQNPINGGNPCQNFFSRAVQNLAI